MKNPVLMNDFKKEYAFYKKDVLSATKRVFESGWYILGPEVKKFEDAFAQYIGTEYSVGLGSGTDALAIALKSLNITDGDEVIIPANVYPSAFGISQVTKNIVLADVDPETLLITKETIEKVLSKNTKAIVVVHLYGYAVDLAPIIKLAKEKNIKVIEDCAQATGTMYKGKHVGSIADVGCFSFYPTKNLGAYGDGGAVTTNSSDIADKAKLYRMYGETARYKSVLLGGNSRLDELHAAILYEKLQKVDLLNSKRIEIASRYHTFLSKLPVKCLIPGEGTTASYHLFVIRTDKRDQLISFLKESNIQTGIHYPDPIHKVQSFSFLETDQRTYPVAESTSKEILSIPIHPFLLDSEVKYVSRKIAEFFQ